MNLKPFTKQEIEGYTNENKFIEDVVIPLFQKLAEVRVYRNNGPVKIENWGKDKRSEGYTGIDVYFGYYDEFSKEKHYGIQCKVKNIVGGSNARLSNSIETISNQIRKAYGSVFTNPLNPQSPAKICGFYIITSKKVTQTARDHFKNLGLPNVEVLDIDDLIYVIEKFTK